MAEMIRTAPRDIHALRVWALVECLERQRELPGRVRPVRPELAVDATLLREVLERLSFEHEELAVAEEGLRVQMEMMARWEEEKVRERALPRAPRPAARGDAHHRPPGGRFARPASQRCGCSPPMERFVASKPLAALVEAPFPADTPLLPTHRS